MKVIYSDQPMDLDGKSIFLAGPTPRSSSVLSWRPQALEILTSLDFQHTVFVPEWDRVPENFMYENQVEWEYAGLEGCSVVLFWVPREMVTMPALTTNVEFGRYVGSGKALYGRPDGAESTRYLDWLYTKLTKKIPFNSLRGLLTEADRLCNL